MNVEVANQAGRFFLPKDMRRVGRFELIMRLGNGGMATVYLARSVSAGGFQRLVAIKLMHPFLASDPHFVEMFLDEARVAATIRHPNVVPLSDLGAEQDQLFMVMDYIEGDTLAAVESTAAKLGRAIPLGIVLRIVLDALAGLEAAHNLCTPDGSPLRVVHRDVSPQNIMVGVDGASRVLDFGIARAEQRLSQTVVGTLKGKAPFMAPEQFDGNAIDRRADIFAMGVTLWEAVALRRLFPGRTADNAHRLTAEYRRLKEILPTVPPGLDFICQKALSVDPDRRFPSASAFADAIEAEFGSIIASHRQVGTFMAAVAADKIQRERDAIRETSTRPGPIEPAPAPSDADSSGSRPSVQVPAEPKSATVTASALASSRGFEQARVPVPPVLPEDADTDALLDALLPSDNAAEEEADLPRPQRPDAALLPQVYRPDTGGRPATRTQNGHEAPRQPAPSSRTTGRIDPSIRTATPNEPAPTPTPTSTYPGARNERPRARDSSRPPASMYPGSRQERQGYSPPRTATTSNLPAPLRTSTSSHGAAKGRTLTSAAPAAKGRTTQRVEIPRPDAGDSQAALPAPARGRTANLDLTPPRRKRTNTLPSHSDRAPAPEAPASKYPPPAATPVRADTPVHPSERLPMPETTIEFNLVRERPSVKAPPDPSELDSFDSDDEEEAPKNLPFEVKLPTGTSLPAPAPDADAARQPEEKATRTARPSDKASARGAASEPPPLTLPSENPVVVARFPSFIEAPRRRRSPLVMRAMMVAAALVAVLGFLVVRRMRSVAKAQAAVHAVSQDPSPESVGPNGEAPPPSPETPASEADASP